MGRGRSCKSALVAVYVAGVAILMVGNSSYFAANVTIHVAGVIIDVGRGRSGLTALVTVCIAGVGIDVGDRRSRIAAFVTHGVAFVIKNVLTFGGRYLSDLAANVAIYVGVIAVYVLNGSRSLALVALAIARIVVDVIGFARYAAFIAFFIAGVLKLVRRFALFAAKLAGRGANALIVMLAFLFFDDFVANVASIVSVSIGANGVRRSYHGAALFANTVIICVNVIAFFSDRAGKKRNAHACKNRKN